MSKTAKTLLSVGLVVGLLLVTGIGGISCCKCLGWNQVTVTWTGSSPGTWTSNCGDIVAISSVNSFTAVSVKSSVDCKPNEPGCQPSYTWSVTTSDGTPMGKGNSLPANFTPTSPGGFKVELNASCDGKSCPPCNIYICINEIQPPPCQCGKWGPVTVIWDYSSAASWIHSPPEQWTGDCGDTITIPTIPLRDSDRDSDLDVHITQITSSINCGSGCTPSYTWNITDSSGVQGPWSGDGLPASFSPASQGTFWIFLNATCDGIECSPCILKVQYQEITCVTIKVLNSWNSAPMPNMTVEAHGLEYDTSGTTDANGLVCLLVPTNSSFWVEAYGIFEGSDYYIYPPEGVTFMAPDFSSGADDCGTPQCPLVGTVYVDLIVGTD
jgi:hypothetical protein